MTATPKAPAIPPTVARALARFCGRYALGQDCFHFDPVDGGRVIAYDGKRMAVVPVAVEAAAPWSMNAKTGKQEDGPIPPWSKVIPLEKPMQEFSLHVDMLPFLRTVDELAAKDEACRVRIRIAGLTWVGEETSWDEVTNSGMHDHAEWVGPTGVTTATMFQAHFLVDLFVLAAALDPTVTVLRCQQWGTEKPSIMRVELPAGAYAAVMPIGEVQE